MDDFDSDGVREMTDEDDFGNSKTRRRSIWPIAVLGIMAIVCGCNQSSKSPYPAGMGKTDDDAPQEFTQTASGLEYRVLRKGTGQAPTVECTVEVNYQGWLDNGTVFDSSYSRGQPATFSLSRVVAGWTEGLQLVGEGGMIELRIPPKLGYGSRGQGNIGPNATLHFIVELLKVVDPNPRAAASVDDTKEVPLPTLPKGAGPIDDDAPKSLIKTQSGLKYRILRGGDGVNPKITSRVRVNYHGWLDDGEVFDSSYESGKPADFAVNGVIKGWTEGLQLVSEGGMIELSIPPSLGYGAAGQGKIGPNATLHFIIELLRVQ